VLFRLPEQSLRPILREEMAAPASAGDVTEPTAAGQPALADGFQFGNAQGSEQGPTTSQLTYSRSMILLQPLMEPRSSTASPAQQIRF